VSLDKDNISHWQFKHNMHESLENKAFYVYSQAFLKLFQEMKRERPP